VKLAGNFPPLSSYPGKSPASPVEGAVCGPRYINSHFHHQFPVIPYAIVGLVAVTSGYITLFNNSYINAHLIYLTTFSFHKPIPYVIGWRYPTIQTKSSRDSYSLIWDWFHCVQLSEVQTKKSWDNVRVIWGFVDDVKVTWDLNAFNNALQCPKYNINNET